MWVVLYSWWFGWFRFKWFDYLVVVLRSCFFGVGLVWVCVCDLCLCLGCSFVGF